MHSQNDLAQLRHSAAHLLAHAVLELYPDTQLTIGPATPEGFFYDCLPAHNFKEEDLPKIELRMREISARNLPLTHTQEHKDLARKRFAGNRFKLELIDQIPGDTVGIASQGAFNDLCRGGHVASTGDIKYFKLLGISGAYWRADRNGQPLQRISGTAFFSQEDLDAYEKKCQDALLYDHRRLGRELDLFSFHEEGPGFVFYHPKGKHVVNKLMEYMRSLLQKFDYQEIATPAMLSDVLWQQSGHYAHYKDNMFFCCIDDRSYAVKPMNCPGAILIYKERPHSYRELPMRLAEFGAVHRYEISGALHGLFRVRAFTQDDCHTFCTLEQIEQEILGIMTMTMHVFTRFNFAQIHIALSTRPEKSMGSDEVWQKSTTALKNALQKAQITYTINEGDGAFYGPKIDISIEDSMGRKWQCGTIQLDFFQPENFDLHYISSAGTKERPVIIHRTIYGSLERFFGILLEHTKGRLPFWVAPVQARILTITSQLAPYAQRIMTSLKDAGFQIECDQSGDPISGQIKRAQLDKIPWMLVLGKKEEEQNTITLRTLDGKQEFGLTLEQILQRADHESK
jgi:threonyl-tRNA synthetase